MRLAFLPLRALLFPLLSATPAIALPPVPSGAAPSSALVAPTKKCRGNEFKRAGCKAKKAATATVKAVGSAAEATGKAAGNVVTAAGDAVKDVVTTVVKGGEDVVKETDRFRRKSFAEGARASVNLMDAGTAVARFAVRQATNPIDIAEQTVVRVREGKIADAFFHAAYDPIKLAEKDAFAATQESKLVAIGGSAAASYFGGPGGAAAFAAWQSYRASGGAVDQALAAGIIAGARAAALDQVGEMPSRGVNAELEKMVVAGAVGGIAAAAEGADADGVRNAFLMNGGLMLVQDGWRGMRAGNFGMPHTPNSPGGRPDVIADARGGPAAAGDTPDPVCVAAIVAACPRLDTLLVVTADSAYGWRDQRMLPSDPKIGDTVVVRPTTYAIQEPYSVPGMTAVALVKDTWVVSWMGGAFTSRPELPPLVVLTYVGTKPLYEGVAPPAAQGAAPAGSGAPKP